VAVSLAGPRGCQALRHCRRAGGSRAGAGHRLHAGTAAHAVGRCLDRCLPIGSIDAVLGVLEACCAAEVAAQALPALVVAAVEGRQRQCRSGHSGRGVHLEPAKRGGGGEWHAPHHACMPCLAVQQSQIAFQAIVPRRWPRSAKMAHTQHSCTATWERGGAGHGTCKPCAAAQHVSQQIINIAGQKSASLNRAMSRSAWHCHIEHRSVAQRT
jgi:hypothetical protein